MMGGREIPEDYDNLDPTEGTGLSYTEFLLEEILKAVTVIAHNTRTTKIEPEGNFRTFGEES